MIYGYARISTDGQSVTAQVAVLRKHGAGKVFREVASGAKDRPAAASPVAGRDQRWRRGDGDAA
jgi:DNA invertase Pin-like site-specific DNA recombinase